MEGETASELRVFEVLNRGEALVDERGAHERQEMSGGLQLRQAEREKQRMDEVGDPQPDAGMPADAVQDDLLAGARAHLAGRANSASSTSSSEMLPVVTRWKIILPEGGARSPPDTATRGGGGPQLSVAAHLVPRCAAATVKLIRYSSVAHTARSARAGRWRSPAAVATWWLAASSRPAHAVAAAVVECV